MSKNDKKYFYKTFAMSNDINWGEGVAGRAGVIIVDVSEFSKVVHFVVK